MTRTADGGTVPLWQPLASAWQPLAQGTGRGDRYCGGRGRPFGFPWRADGRTLTGGRLTAEAAEGVVTIRNNRLSQEVLRGISAAPLLPDERPE